MTIEKLAVVGGGAWGTALAQVAATGGRETLLWALEDDVVTAVNEIHENPVYLKGLKLHANVRATSNFSDLAAADAWLVVTPALHMRAVLGRTPCPNMPLVLCSKGIEERSGMLFRLVDFHVLLQRVDQVFAQIFRRDRAVTDFAQGDDRVLVTVTLDSQLGAARNLARPLCG